jgi:hypothetical protein
VVMPTYEEDEEALTSLPEAPDMKPGSKRKNSQVEELPKKVIIIAPDAGSWQKYY